jgi:hypothetical protein
MGINIINMEEYRERSYHMEYKEERIHTQNRSHVYSI